MASNAGPNLVTEPVQLTARLRPAAPGESGYLVTATVGSRPPVTGHFEAPPRDGERVAYERAATGADAAPIGTADAAADTGMRLFDALFSGALRRCWAQAVEEARTPGLRLVVDSAENAIHSLPWELLFDRVLINQHLALVDGWSVLRAVPEPPPPASPRPAGKVTVQVVNSRASGDSVPVAQLIQEGLPAASVRSRRGQATAELESVLREQTVDVLHIAAGGVELPDGRQYLTLGDAASTDPSAVVVLVAATELLDILREARRRPSLIVLTGSDTEGLAAELARAIPAVIGIRGDISDKGCESFLRGFYQALGRGGSIEAALAAGRAGQREFGSTLGADWAAPVGFLSGPQRLVVGVDEIEADSPDETLTHDPEPAPQRPVVGPAQTDRQASAPNPTEDRLELELRMRELDLDELLTRWEPIDGSLWPEAVRRRRVDLEAAIAESNRRLGGRR